MTLDLTNFRKPGEKTFTQRSRLFVGNLPVDIPEEEFKGMFSKYGDVNEVFINRERGFGFIRLVNNINLIKRAGCQFSISWAALNESKREENNNKSDLKLKQPTLIPICT